MKKNPLSTLGYSDETVEKWQHAVILARPPTANQLYIYHQGLRRRLKTHQYRQWQTQAVISIQEQVRQLGLGSEEIQTPFGVWIMASVDRKSDIDNLVKPTVDALVKSCLVRGDQWMDSVLCERRLELPKDTVLLAWRPLQ